MRTFILSMFALALFAADPPSDKPLPQSVTPIIKDYTDSIQKAKATYDAACVKAAEKATAALDTKSKELGKKGDLDGAIAVKTVIDKIKNSTLKEDAEKKLAEDLLGDAKAKPEFFVGSWDIVGISPLKINEDGTAVWGSVPGTWTKGEKTIKFSWGNEIDIPTTKNCKVVDHGRNDAVYQMVKTK